jgi:benzoate membrane transport protein
MEIIEKGYGLGWSLKRVITDTNSAGLATAAVGGAWGTLGPGLIVINAAQTAGLNQGLIVSWLFGLYIFIGVATMFVALRYRVPMVIAYSIPGAILLGTLLPQFTLSEAAGAYMVVGLVVAVLTVTGIIKKIVNKIPGPIMVGMIGGVLFHIGEGFFKACIEQPKIYGIMLLCFLCVTGYKKLSRKVPPIIVAIIVGGVLLQFNGLINYSQPLTIQIAKPEFVCPLFSWRAIVEISIPMFFLVVGVQNIQAVGVLMAEGYKPPINAMYFVPAVGCFITALMGAHCPTMGGPGTAIVSSPAANENKDLRYVAAFYKGILFVLFALLSSIAVGAIKMVPREFILVLAGMALLHVFSNTFLTAFSGKFRTGALISFFVAVTNIALFGIGAPLWAILFGVLASLVVESSDFRTHDGAKVALAAGH